MKHRRLAGCIPVRNLESGDLPDQLLILLISSRRHPSRLLFPKGGVKANEEPEAAAKRETWEEAGVLGTIVARLQPPAEQQDEYHNDDIFCWDGESDGDDFVSAVAATRTLTGSRNSSEANQHCRWYLLSVSHEHDLWPEQGQRSRHWLTLKDALKLENIRDGTRESLTRLQDFLQKHHHHHHLPHYESL